MSGLWHYNYNKFLLTELSRSLWENLDLGRENRPNVINNILTGVEVAPSRVVCFQLLALQFRLQLVFDGMPEMNLNLITEVFFFFLLFSPCFFFVMSMDLSFSIFSRNKSLFLYFLLLVTFHCTCNSKTFLDASIDGKIFRHLPSV